jgi:DNA-binding response OmpR family regulator
MTTHILSIGQCGFDDSRIARMMADTVGGFVDRAATAGEARELLKSKPYRLVLVNRVFDADGESGVDFIGEITQGGDSPPVMLVSDYVDAQAAAMANGAVKGFGKSRLFDPETVTRLRALLTAAPA